MNTSEPTFRDFQPADIEKVAALLRSNIPKYFVPAEEQELRDYLAEHPEDYWLLEEDGETVAAGGVALNSDGSVGLCWGMVRNDLIGTGLGKRLTLFALKKRVRMGHRPFMISTSHHTEASTGNSASSHRAIPKASAPASIPVKWCVGKI